MSSSQLLSVAALQKSLIPATTNEEGWTELALSIHRGRDHGIPAYVEALHLCDGSNQFNKHEHITFDNLAKYSRIPEEHVTILRDIYEYELPLNL